MGPILRGPLQAQPSGGLTLSVTATLYETECSDCGADTEKVGGCIGYDGDRKEVTLLCKQCSENYEHLMIWIEWEPE